VSLLSGSDPGAHRINGKTVTTTKDASVVERGRNAIAPALSDFAAVIGIPMR
jgi:hypothetical protein